MDQILEITVVTPQEDGFLLVPMGTRTPHGSTRGFQASIPFQEITTDPTDQRIAVLSPIAGEAVTITYEATPDTAPFDARIWQDWGSAYTVLDEKACAEARDVAANAQDPIQAIVDHVTALFTYGHVDQSFYDGQEQLPQLCQLTTGSCVDINAYLIACLRAAGCKAGYVTGYFFPAEKAGETTDMHCWVVTECDQGLRYWDIAHFLKMERRDVGPALNPKPGCRVPIAFAMGHDIPAFSVKDVKLLAEPIILSGNGFIRPEMTITLTPWLGETL